MIDNEIKKIEILEGEKKDEVYESVKDHLGYLPKRFHEEFIIELLGSSPQSPKTVQKNWEMYWETIYDELTSDEKNGVFDDSIIILNK